MKQKKKEPLYPQDPSINQSERLKQLAMEAYNRRKKYDEEREKYRRMLQEEQRQPNSYIQTKENKVWWNSVIIRPYKFVLFLLL